MIGIGIIGGGRVSRAHATAAQALRGTRLVAISEIDDERRVEGCARHGCAGYADYHDLLADAAVDAVVIGLPHWLHCPAAIDSLAAGKHVLLEKPMAMTVEECDRIIAAEQASGRMLMVAHSQHFFPSNQAARRLIAEGGIGALVMATDTWYKPFHDGPRPAWFLDDARGGGMWPMNGSHMIDRLMFLSAESVVSVKARVGNPTFGLSTDMGQAFLQFESGFSAIINHVGFRDGVNRFEAELTGTQAQLHIDSNRGGAEPLRLSRSGKWEELPVTSPRLDLREGAEAAGPFVAQMQEFAAAIGEKRAPAVTSAYGAEVVRVLEACVESSRSGRDVMLRF